jgi:murein DD-endopeptidase MepM/ murein hydrolase activator NlpD
MAFPQLVRGGGVQTQPYGCSSYACGCHCEWNCPQRGCSCRYGFHAGLDVAAAWLTPLLAIGYGTRVYRRRDPGSCGGLGPFAVCITSGGVDVWYGHLSKDLVGIGATVVPGQVVGLMGSLGCSTGTHVHYEVQPAGSVDGCRSLDPGPYLTRWPGASPVTPPPPGSVPPAKSNADWLLLAGAGLLLAAGVRR